MLKVASLIDFIETRTVLALWLKLPSFILSLLKHPSNDWLERLLDTKVTIYSATWLLEGNRKELNEWQFW